MARGKHRARAANVRTQTLQAAKEQLLAELASEEQMLSEVTKVLDEAEVLQNELGQAGELLRSETSSYRESLRQDRELLFKMLIDAKEQSSIVTDQWRKYSDKAIDLMPGNTGTERIEAFMKVLGNGGWLSDDTPNKGASLEMITKLQRARGVRTNAVETSTEQTLEDLFLTYLALHQSKKPLFSHEFMAELEEADIVTPALSPTARTFNLRPVEDLSPEQLSVKANALALTKRLKVSRPSDLNAESVIAWGEIATSIQDTAAPLYQSLGAVFQAGEHALPPQAPELHAISPPLPSMSSSTREVLTQLSPERVFDKWVPIIRGRRAIAESLGLNTSQFGLPPHQPQPSQSVSLQNLYSVAAFSRWIRYPSDDNAAQAAIGVTAAANYWLPAGQTAAFAESEALSDEDRNELVLPFPQVLLTFAEPLLLQPQQDPDVDEQRLWKKISDVLSFKMGRTSEVTVESAFFAEYTVLQDDANDDQTPTSVEQMVRNFGGYIEGVLLLADALGRPDDRFAWCLTIPGAYGETLGRFVLPAQRSKTEYRDTIDNLTAVVAWAQWHEPDPETIVPLGLPLDEVKAIVSTSEFKRTAKRTGSDLRVIDVGRTNRTQSRRIEDDSEEVGTRYPVTPHVRRGHWRRQRYGAKLTQVRRLRIAPVLVNAHLGNIQARVYRLPVQKDR